MGCFNFVEQWWVRKKEGRREKSRRHRQEKLVKRLQEKISIKPFDIERFIMEGYANYEGHSSHSEEFQHHIGDNESQESEVRKLQENAQHRTEKSRGLFDRRSKRKSHALSKTKAGKLLLRLLGSRDESQKGSARSGSEDKKPRRPHNRREREAERERLRQREERRHRQLRQALEAWLERIGGSENFEHFMSELKRQTGNWEEDRWRRDQHARIMSIFRDVANGPKHVEFEGEGDEPRPRHGCLDLFDILIGAVSLVVILAVVL